MLVTEFEYTTHMHLHTHTHTHAHSQPIWNQTVAGSNESRQAYTGQDRLRGISEISEWNNSLLMFPQSLTMFVFKAHLSDHTFDS